MAERSMALHGFEARTFATAGAEIPCRIGGDGPPLVLLHGYPQTHLCWRHVAPRLAEHFTVVLPDLRGYGASRGPSPDPEHLGYSKRAMAEDVVAVMRELGHDRFQLAGHDRGGRVAYRLALDHPERVDRLAVLDIVPTLESAELCDAAMAQATYHWFFLAQPAPLPERLIGHDPDFFLDWTIGSWLGRPGTIEEPAMAAYREAFRRPEVIAATCEDYRAGLSVDLAHDRADREAGNKITCPLLALWGEVNPDVRSADPLQIWRRWALEVDGQPLPCGHFLAEELPEETTAALAQFFEA